MPPAVEEDEVIAEENEVNGVSKEKLREAKVSVSITVL